MLLAAALAFSILYPSLVGTNLGMQLDALSRTYFNKNFFSGREVVWNMVLTSVRRHELLGMGLAMTPSNIYNTVYSSHNLYLQTVLQSGIIGLALLLLLLWGILCTFATRLSNGACIGASVIACVLVHEALEVSLTQNNFTVGILFWILMGAALSVARLETGDAT